MNNISINKTEQNNEVKEKNLEISKTLQQEKIIEPEIEKRKQKKNC